MGTHADGKVRIMAENILSCAGGSEGVRNEGSKVSENVEKERKERERECVCEGKYKTSKFLSIFF